MSGAGMLNIYTAFLFALSLLAGFFLGYGQHANRYKNGKDTRQLFLL
jgi:hypothetical protein